jgi:heterotetrameric sarcosine oxidase gamma subunit
VSAPEGSLEAVLAPGRHGARTDDPVRIAIRRCGLVHLSARRGRAQELEKSIRGALHLELPEPGYASNGGALSALWQQPNVWMLVAPTAEEGTFARTVKAACGDAGSVADQTHGRTVLTLSGRHARRVLAKLCRLDLHPRAFTPGRVATTRMVEITCTLHQRDETPSYELMVLSTYAAHFAAALTHAAAELGYEIA